MGLIRRKDSGMAWETVVEGDVGSQIVQRTSHSLLPAELYALSTVPVAITDEPAAGKAIIPICVAAYFEAGDIPYNFATTPPETQAFPILQYGFLPDPTTERQGQIGELDDAQSWLDGFNGTDDFYMVSYADVSGTLLVTAPLRAVYIGGSGWGTPIPDTGNGVLTFTTVYYELDI